ncbi:MAG TPA: hypothetical protein VJ798_14050 [Rhizomicrobium sp.]|nr:hypothetical protein [Rhizomicrobium sp.]
MNRTILAGIAIAMLGATAALAQQGVANSTNSYTPAQRAAAEAAVKAAGYTPGAISYAQAGTIFIHGTKDGQRVVLTVTSDGKVHASTGSTAPMPAETVPAGGRGGAPDAGRGGRGGE